MRWATSSFSFSGTWRIVVGILAPHSSQKVDIPFFLAMIPTRCDWGDHVGCWSEVEVACREMAVLWRHAARIGREDLVLMAVARLGNNFVSEFIAGSNCCLVEKKFGWAKGGRFFDVSTWHSPAEQFLRYFSLAEHRPRLIPSSYISTYVSVRNLDYVVALDRDGWIDGWMDGWDELSYSILDWSWIPYLFVKKSSYHLAHHSPSPFHFITPDYHTVFQQPCTFTTLIPANQLFTFLLAMVYVTWSLQYSAQLHPPSLYQSAWRLRFTFSLHWH